MTRQGFNKLYIPLLTALLLFTNNSIARDWDFEDYFSGGDVRVYSSQDEYGVSFKCENNSDEKQKFRVNGSGTWSDRTRDFDKGCTCYADSECKIRFTNTDNYAQMEDYDAEYSVNSMGSSSRSSSSYGDEKSCDVEPLMRTKPGYEKYRCGNCSEVQIKVTKDKWGYEKYDGQTHLPGAVRSACR